MSNLFDPRLDPVASEAWRAALEDISGITSVQVQYAPMWDTVYVLVRHNGQNKRTMLLRETFEDMHDIAIAEFVKNLSAYGNPTYEAADDLEMEIKFVPPEATTLFGLPVVEGNLGLPPLKMEVGIYCAACGNAVMPTEKNCDRCGKPKE